MFMLKRTHEKKVRELVDLQILEIESVKQDYEQQIEELKFNQNVELLKLNEDHYDDIRCKNRLIKKRDIQIDTLTKTIKGYIEELENIRKKYKTLSSEKGGYTKYKHKLENQLEEQGKDITALTFELGAKLCELKELEDAIIDFSKPTHEESKFSVIKHDKKKVIDHERNAKTSKLYELAKDIHKRRAEEYRNNLEEQLAEELETPLEVIQEDENTYIIKDKNNKK